jgi:hypothetical protein
MQKLTQLVALAAFAALPAAAQTTGADWRPFRVGHTYVFETNIAPQLETVRLAAGRAVGADSVYTFADYFRPARPGDTIPSSCSGTGFFQLQFLREPVTAFLTDFHVPAQGDYALGYANVAPTHFLPRRPPRVGASWVFSQGQTATVTQLGIQMVGTAGVMDSVMVATLPGGEVIKISKSFGLFAGPDLRPPVGVPLPPLPNLALHMIPERALGSLPNNQPPDWQPGDSSVYYRVETSGSMFICSESHFLKRYLTRTIAGDFIIRSYR